MITLESSSQQPIKCRLPPLFLEAVEDKSWVATPENWLYGCWYMTHTSQKYYLEGTKNFVIQYGPVMNGVWPCSNQELVSLTPLTQPDRVYTAFGIDTPVAGLNDAWLCQCTGHLSHISDYVAFLAWGKDNRDMDWVVLYSTPPSGATVGLPAQVAIMSRARCGPDEITVEKIKDGLRAMGNVELCSMVDNIRTLPHDPIEPEHPTCEYHVVQNVDSLTRF
ncbi:atp-dependent RNA helicase dbp9 protein [Rutstroemia sp. NJR-2017a BVV2]|nr:atp-dependent RNA helicase dbp9 protein [Rutstroemia sp. NJR-2017a BVV2]